MPIQSFHSALNDINVAYSGWFPRWLPLALTLCRDVSPCSGVPRRSYRGSEDEPETLPEQRSPLFPPRLPRLPCRGLLPGGAGDGAPEPVQEVRRSPRGLKAEAGSYLFFVRVLCLSVHVQAAQRKKARLGW